MVTNTSGNIQVADVFLNFDGQQHQSPEIVFNPHETKILSIIELLTKLNLSPAQEPQGSITLIQRGSNPAFIAQGRVTDPVTGFSSTLEFPDPARQKASSLHASGIPIGTPSADSPFGGDGTFIPHVVASNLSNAPESVTITVEYPQRDTLGTDAKAILAPIGAKEFDGESGVSVGQAAVASFQVPAYSTEDFLLFAELGQLPLPLPYASVRIQYSGAPGSVIAQVSSVDERQDLVVDARTMNEGDGWAGWGANPWHVDSQTDSILFLTDESDEPVRIGFHVVANGVTYHLTSLQLNPHETRAINIRKLRDAQNADFLKNKIPAGASDGSVEWNRIDNVAVTGRVVVIQKSHGTASGYDCCTCPCPESYHGLSVTPAPSHIIVGGNVLLSATATYQACNNGPKDYCDVSTQATWTSGTPSVAVMNPNDPGEADGLAAGSSSITAKYSDYVYSGTSCTANLAQHQGSATCWVIGVSVTTIDLPSDTVAVYLSPIALSGQLVITWNGPSGNAYIANQTESGGTYTFNPSLSTLVTGTYTGATAQWTVGSFVASGTKTNNFNVLGTYTHTQYNTPAESQCTGGAATAYLTTGPTACPWFAVSLIQMFITQAWINGSGATNNYGLIQEYLAGCSVPPGGNQNYFREVSQVTPGCSSPNNFLGNSTVAVEVSSTNHPLKCGDQVLIVGLGSGVGTTKTATDSCPACTGESHIDDFNTSSACSLPTLGSFKTIRINR